MSTPPTTSPPTPPVLADELLLLLLDPVSGKPRVDGTKLELALAGALLIELALDRRIDVDGPSRRAKVTVSATSGDPVVPETPQTAQTPLVPATATASSAAGGAADELLEDAVRRVAERRRRADQLVPALAKGLRARLLDRAQLRGDVRHLQDRVLGIFPRHRWPAADGTAASRSAGRRRQVRDALVAGVEPDPRTRALIALLAAIDAAPAALDAEDVPDRAARRGGRAPGPRARQG